MKLEEQRDQRRSAEALLKKNENILWQNVDIVVSKPTEISPQSSLFKDEERGLTQRDQLYTALLNAYVKDYDVRHKSNRGYKKIFFWFVILIFACTITGSVITLITLAARGMENPSVIAVALSAFGTILSALIIIPKIIAKYLFPANEDDKVTEMVKTMQENDSKTRESHTVKR